MAFSIALRLQTQLTKAVAWFVIS